MNSVVLSTSQEIKGGEKLKKLKNNKGFSLVELLIVIAIMGVLAVIAFNMFGGVLSNSKKRADDRQAENIAKAVLTYCIDSNNWDLAAAKDEDGTGTIEVKLEPTKLIQTLMDPVYDSEGKEYGPYFTKKDPTVGADAEPNASAYLPQWHKDKGGEYLGWKITIYKKSQTVKCVPVKEAEIAVDVEEL